MKKVLSMLVAVAIGSSATSAILTVSNSVHLPAQYSTLQEAHDAAASGDTLLVQGTNMSYGNLNVTKQIHIYGNKSSVNQGVRMNTLSLKNGLCSGSVFESIRMEGVTNDGEPGDITNVTFRRCVAPGIGFTITSVIHLENWLIEGCVFTATGTNIYSLYGNCNYGVYLNFTLRNCVFGGKLAALANSTVENCVFINTASDSPSTSCVTYTNYSNNIFYGATPSEEYYSHNNSYLNNLSYGGNPVNFTIPASPADSPYNVGANNQTSSDPDFVAVAINTVFEEAMDFMLQPGSPAIGAGVDGVDVGVYNGTGYFRSDLEPTIPVVRSLTIPGGNTVPAEGSFQITIHSVSHP